MIGEFPSTSLAMYNVYMGLNTSSHICHPFQIIPNVKPIQYMMREHIEEPPWKAADEEKVGHL